MSRDLALDIRDRLTRAGFRSTVKEEVRYLPVRDHEGQCVALLIEDDDVARDVTKRMIKAGVPILWPADQQAPGG